MELTREQIKKMPAGRELDAAIGEQVLGLVWVHNSRYGSLRTEEDADMLVEDGYSNYGQHPDNHYVGPDDKYSTDIAAAWLVIEAMRGRGWYSEHTDLTLGSGTEWWSWHFTDNTPPGNTSVSAQADTAPLAICRAALLAFLPDSPTPSHSTIEQKPQQS